MKHSPRKLILHAGMYKTGSTSIQYFCTHATLRNTHYFRLGRPNHSRAFKLLFGQETEDSWFREKAGSAQADPGALRTEVARKIRKQVRKSEHSQFVFSSERMSAAGRTELVKCRKFFAKHFDDIDVYLYYRNPFTYAASRLQQRLKFGVLPSAETILPKYRDGIEPLDNIFGVLNVHIRSMEQAVQQNASIVTDFNLWTGIDSGDDTKVQRNTSLSAEATALLFLYQKTLGPRIDSIAKRKQHNVILQKLRHIRGGKLVLGSGFFEAQSDAIAKDCAWLATRVDGPVSDTAPTAEGAVEIASFDALEHLGRQVFHRLASTDFDRAFPAAGQAHDTRDFIDLLPQDKTDLRAPETSG